MLNRQLVRYLLSSGILFSLPLVLFAQKPGAQSVAELPKPGKSVEKTLKRGETHTFQITLPAHQFFKAGVTSPTLPLTLRVLNEAEKTVAQATIPSIAKPTVSLSFVTETPGRYQVTISSTDQALASGRYTLRVEAIRQASRLELSELEIKNLTTEVDRLKQKTHYSEAIALAQRTLERAKTELGPEHPQVAEILNVFGQLHWYQGEFEKAESLFTQALALREKIVGAEHLETATSLNNLALLAQQKGDFSKAEQLFLRALAIREKNLGTEHALIATTLNNLASLYEAAGNSSKAEPLLERALAISEKVFGPAHSLVATSLNNLAMIYKGRSDYAKAEPLMVRALAIREKIVGAEHPDTATSLQTLAALYQEMSQFDKAEPLALRALAINEKVLGQQHPETASSLNMLGELYYYKGNYAASETYMTRAVAASSKANGPEHNETATYINNLGSLYQAKGEYTKAETFFQQAVAIHEKTLGPEHPSTANSLNNLANLYKLKSDYVKAEPLLIRALAIREKVLGKNHLDVAITLNNVSGLYWNKGEYGKAVPYLERAAVVLENVLGPNHRYLGVTLGNLAVLYQEQKEFAKAEPLFKRAVEIAEKNLGPDHPDTAGAYNTFGLLYKDTREFSKAEPLLVRALAIREKTLSPDHPKLALSLNNLGALYFAQGDAKKAEPLLVRALTIREKTLGSDHPDTANSLSNLAGVYASLGTISQALKYQARGNEVTERDICRNLITGSEQQKLFYLAKTTDYLDWTLSLQAKAAPDDVEAVRTALQVVFQRKGRALDAMASSIETLRQRATPEDQALLDELARAQTELAGLTLRGPGKAGAAQHQLDLAAATEKVERLQGQIGARNAQFRTQFQPITIDAVQQAIPQGAALVEFVAYRIYNPQAQHLGERHYAAYVLNRQGNPQWADLGKAEPIETAAQTLRQLLANRRSHLDRDIKPAARKLDELILQPVRTLVGDARQLLLSPDGSLNLVPFAVLVDSQGRFLVEKYSLSYLTSGRDLLRLQVKIDSHQPPLIVADPEYGQGNGPILLGHQSQPLVQLPGTAREGKEIARLLPASQLEVGEAATKARLKQVDRPVIVHIATHGYFLRDASEDTTRPDLEDRRDTTSPSQSSADLNQLRRANPLLRSCLFFAGANQGANQSASADGVMTALETAGLNLWGTKLVVLSACDSGLGEVKTGDGVYGLRRALVLAGSETQLMSLWSVSDVATRELMVEYYTRLNAGEGRSEALRQVQLRMLRNPNRRHPYYWSAFIQSGEWAALTERNSEIAR